MLQFQLIIMLSTYDDNIRAVKKSCRMVNNIREYRKDSFICCFLCSLTEISLMRAIFTLKVFVMDIKCSHLFGELEEEEGE